MACEAKRKAQGSGYTYIYQGPYDILSRAAPAESIVAWKTGMGPISSSSQELRSSPKEEQN